METEETQMIVTENDPTIMIMQATIEEETQRVCAGVVWWGSSLDSRRPGIPREGYWLSVNSQYVDHEETLWLAASFHEASARILSVFQESVMRYACPF